jgi:competence protein ComEC
VKQFSAWPLLCGSIALISGIAVGSLGKPSAIFFSCIFITSLSLIGVAFSWVSEGVWRGWLIWSCLVALGIVYATLRTLAFPITNIEDKLVKVQAIVVSNGSFSNDNQQLYLDLIDGHQRKRVRATLPTTDQFLYGQIITFSGSYITPRDDASFVESSFLRAHNAQGKIKATEVEATDIRVGNVFLQRMHDFRLILLDRMLGIRQPERQIVAGVVLGDTASLPVNIKESFRRAGTTHMLVASGANVAILAWIIERVFIGLGLHLSLFITGGALLSFVAMTGGEASIFRAVMLYLVLILAKLSGRRIHAPTLVTFVALVMAAINPWVILYDPSFQLSFAAVIGLLIFGEWFSNLLPTWWLKEFFAPTLAAEVVTLPILLYSFGQLSIISPIVNLISLPLITPIMIGGIITLFVPWFKIIPWLTEGITTVLLWIVAYGARLPWASLTTDTHRIAWSGMAFCVFCCLCLIRYRHRVNVSKEERG